MEPNKTLPELHTKLLKARDILQRNDGELDEKENKELSFLYREIEGLNFIPDKLRVKVNKMLRLRYVDKGKKLIDKRSNVLPCYVVLTGLFRLERDKEKVSIGPGDTFGDFHLFNNKPWKPTDVVAIENSSVAEFYPELVNRLILEEDLQNDFKSLIKFLRNAIPGFKFMSNRSQIKLARYFQTIVVGSNHYLIKEGLPVRSAYLIYEGVCNISSLNNPLIKAKMQKTVLNLNSLRLSAKQRLHNKPMDGYMCKSTNTYQYSIVTAKEWVGDEVLLDFLTYQSSVIAKTKVVALEISKENLEKFPSHILQNLISNAKGKMVIQDIRKETLEANLTKVYNMNPKYSTNSKELTQEIAPHSYSRIEVKASNSLLRYESIRGNHSIRTSMDKYNQVLEKLRPKKKVLNSASLFDRHGKKCFPVIRYDPLASNKLTCVTLKKNLRDYVGFKRNETIRIDQYQDKKKLFTSFN